MPGGGVRGFGELEAAIMDRVWSAGRPVLVREIHDALRPEREPAYNTVLTVVEILYRKGWLARQRDGRAFRYWATVSREEHAADRRRCRAGAGAVGGPGTAAGDRGVVRADRVGGGLRRAGRAGAGGADGT